ncbi:hypothetical protein Ddc_15209 [Ditylenchus destructor]|nr:hypothetical protein Ddc_15209 [Ditylenchus destructor]
MDTTRELRQVGLQKGGGKSSVEYDDDEIKVISEKKEAFGKGTLTLEEKRKLRNYEYAQEQVEKGIKRARTAERVRSHRASLDLDVKGAVQARDTEAHREHRKDPIYKAAEQARNTEAHRVARARPLKQYESYLKRNSHHFWDKEEMFREEPFTEEDKFYCRPVFYKGFLYFWNRLEQRILSECLMRFCDKNAESLKDCPEEITDYEVCTRLKDLKDFAHDIEYIDNDLWKKACTKFEDRILYTRKLKRVPFYMLQLYLQPDIYRMRGEGLTGEQMDEKYKFIKSKIVELLVKLAPEIEVATLELFAETMVANFLNLQRITNSLNFVSNL